MFVQLTHCLFAFLSTRLPEYAPPHPDRPVGALSHAGPQGVNANRSNYIAILMHLLTFYREVNNHKMFNTVGLTESLHPDGEMSDFYSDSCDFKVRNR